MRKGVKIQIPKSLRVPKNILYGSLENTKPILFDSFLHRKHQKKIFFAGLRPASYAGSQK